LTAEEFDSIWKILEDSSANECVDGIIIRRVSPDIPHDIFLGFEIPSNRRMFMIRVNKRNLSEFRQLPAFKGFEITTVSIPEEQNQYVTLGFILSDPVFRDIFSTLCEDIFETAIIEKTQEIMINSVKNRLLMWKQFLESFGIQGLSSEYQRGLFGELRFLRDMLMPAAGIEKAIHAWKGPSKSNQDFQISGIGIEVKTSIAKQHQKIPIASEQQLDDSGLKALYIYHLSIREINEQGETLPGIINHIRELIFSQNGPIHEFETQLFKAGYLDKHREKYEKKGYVDRDNHFFRVNDRFPRIIEDDLKSGVGDVHYTLDVSACMPFSVHREEFFSDLKRSANGQ